MEVVYASYINDIWSFDNRIDMGRLFRNTKAIIRFFSFDDANVHVTTLITWMWVWWGFTCLGASFAFESMKSKTRRITNLMVPATTFEKYFLHWLIYVLILPLLIYFFIILADYTVYLFVQ